MKASLLIFLAAVLVTGSSLTIMNNACKSGHHAWCAPISDIRHHVKTGRCPTSPNLTAPIPFTIVDLVCSMQRSDVLRMKADIAIQLVGVSPPAWPVPSEKIKIFLDIASLETLWKSY
jgi:hypothetical protein